MAIISIQVDEELKAKIDELAKEDHSNTSVIVRKAVYEYVSTKQSPINKKSATKKAV